MIVMKFGGSSVESATAIERVAGIVKSRLDRHPVVVVSAMGKTTNRLLEIAQTAGRGERDQALALLDDLQRFHQEQTAHLPDAAATIECQFRELTELIKGLAMIGELTPRSRDRTLMTA